MIRRASSIAVAAYILLGIIIGGSGQNAWTNLALQLTGVGLIAWAAIAPRREGDEISRIPDLFVLAVIALVVLQLIPLPPAVWSELPGRAQLVDGFRSLGSGLPALPVSLTLYQSIFALFAAIPAVATFLAIRHLAASQRLVAIAVVVGMVIGVIAGALQVAGGRGSWAYFYEITNEGAVGFFANRNHMATLLLVSVPMIAALAASAISDKGGSAAARYGTAFALLILVSIGIALNGSLAAIALIVPVAIASALLVPAGAAWRWLALPLTGLALLAGIAVIALNPVASTAVQFKASDSVSSRSEIWSETADSIQNTFPVGTGFGSFEQVYRFNENPSAVTRHYVNHAHNDYLELVLEFGLPGLILILLFLVWWLRAAVRIWKSPISTPFQRAATIATAAMLAHSLVDFPLRTAALSAIFAALVAIMSQHGTGTATRRNGERSPRHLSLG